MPIIFYTVVNTCANHQNLGWVGRVGLYVGDTLHLKCPRGLVGNPLGVVRYPSVMDLVPLAVAGPGQGLDVPGESGGDDDQPSQLYAAQCESWEVPRNTDFVKYFFFYYPLLYK